jgi:hypothetical protein
MWNKQWQPQWVHINNQWHFVAQTRTIRSTERERAIRQPKHFTAQNLHGHRLCFVCFHGRPWQVTDVPQPCWLFVPPALDFQLWPPDASAPTDASRTLASAPTDASRTLAAEVGTLWVENEDRQFSLKRRLPRYILGIFYMPQICDMGPTALLPFRRKACWGFSRP